MAPDEQQFGNSQGCWKDFTAPPTGLWALPRQGRRPKTSRATQLDICTTLKFAVLLLIRRHDGSQRRCLLIMPRASTASRAVAPFIIYARFGWQRPAQRARESGELGREGGAGVTERWMDVSKSDDSHGERAFPSTGSKKEAVIELLVDCCLVTAGDGREGQERERQLLHAAFPILIPFSWKMPSLTNG